jgi:adenosine kinase
MLIVTGTLAYDYIMDFPGQFADHILPHKLHSLNISFIVKTFAKRRGGTAGNVSHTLGLLSTPHVLFSIAGKDFDEYKRHLETLHIDISHIMIDKNDYSATGFAMTDEKDNQIWGYFYGAAEKMDKLLLKNVVSSSNDYVLIGPSGARGSLSFVKQCVKNNISYFFDPGFILTQVSNEELHFGIQHAYAIVGNDYEIGMIKKRIKIFDKLCQEKIVITTLGEKGALIEKDRKRFVIGVVNPTKVLDPTGAGDAFRSGFLAGFLKKYPLVVCGQMGAVAASFALEHYGTQEHFFTKEAFCERYRQAYKTLLEL